MSSHPNVLIVDDEERFRTTMCKLLTVRGLEASTVGSGKEALEKLRDTPHDIVILDIRMPEMGGIELLKNIKEAIELCLEVEEDIPEEHFIGIQQVQVSA